MAESPAHNQRAIDDVMKSVVTSLRAIDRVDTIWRRGLVHAGGPHYRLSGTTGPVSIGEDECSKLGKLIVTFRLSRGFIIGNGFGLSSAFIATIMQDSGGTSLVTVDDMTEGDGRRCFDTAEKLRRRLGCQILRNERGRSPEDIGRVAGTGPYDLVLIDGNHAHPHVIADFRGVQPLLRNDSIVCWHDYWLEGVASSVSEARRAGFHCAHVKSSCEMVFGTKDERVCGAIRTLFDAGEPPERGRHPMARLTVSASSLWARMKRRAAALQADRRQSG